MKAKEIIEELSKVDPETEVYFEMADGCCGDTEYLDPVEIDIDLKGKYNTEDRARFYFGAPWFLASCRKAGAAKRAAQEIIDSQAKWQKEQEEKSKK